MNTPEFAMASLAFYNNFTLVDSREPFVECLFQGSINVIQFWLVHQLCPFIEKKDLPGLLMLWSLSGTVLEVMMEITDGSACCGSSIDGPN